LHVQLLRLLGLASVVAVCWGLLSILAAPPYLVAITPLPVTETPESRSQPFQEVTISSDDVPLSGWWLPASTPIAELIFVHGAGSNRVSKFIGSLDFYRTLHELGISVVTMDLRNHGNSPLTDKTIHMGATEWRDVSAAAAWLDKHQPSQLPRYVLGASMGGSAAIRALHRRDLGVDGLILLDPQLDTYDSLIHGAAVTTGLPAPLFSLAAAAAIARYELPSGQDNPLTLATTLSLPILLIQDWDDPVTRSQFARRLSERNGQVQLARVPDIEKTAPCLTNKNRWGSHVAAHPCHPEWTRATIKTFIEQRR